MTPPDALCVHCGIRGEPFEIVAHGPDVYRCRDQYDCETRASREWDEPAPAALPPAPAAAPVQTVEPRDMQSVAREVVTAFFAEIDCGVARCPECQRELADRFAAAVRCGGTGKGPSDGE